MRMHFQNRLKGINGCQYWAMAARRQADGHKLVKRKGKLFHLAQLIIL